MLRFWTIITEVGRSPPRLERPPWLHGKTTLTWKNGPSLAWAQTRKAWKATDSVVGRDGLHLCAPRWIGCEARVHRLRGGTTSSRRRKEDHKRKRAGMLPVPKAPAAVPFSRSTLSVAGTVGVRFGLEVLCLGMNSLLVWEGSWWRSCLKLNFNENQTWTIKRLVWNGLCFYYFLIINIFFKVVRLKRPLKKKLRKKQIV